MCRSKTQKDLIDRERLLYSVVSISHHIQSISNRDPNISADKPPRFSVVIQHCANDCRHPSVQRIGSPFSPDMESGGSRVSRLRAFAGHRTGALTVLRLQRFCSLKVWWNSAPALQFAEKVRRVSKFKGTLVEWFCDPRVRVL